MFIVSTETPGYKIVIDQSLALYAIYKHSPLGLPSGVMLIYCIQILGVVNNYYLYTYCYGLLYTSILIHSESIIIDRKASVECLWV